MKHDVILPLRFAAVKTEAQGGGPWETWHRSAAWVERSSLLHGPYATMPTIFPPLKTGMEKYQSSKRLPLPLCLLPPAG